MTIDRPSARCTVTDVGWQWFATMWTLPTHKDGSLYLAKKVKKDPIYTSVKDK